MCTCPSVRCSSAIGGSVISKFGRFPFLARSLPRCPADAVSVHAAPSCVAREIVAPFL